MSLGERKSPMPRRYPASPITIALALLLAIVPLLAACGPSATSTAEAMPQTPTMAPASPASPPSASGTTITPTTAPATATRPPAPIPTATTVAKQADTVVLAVSMEPDNLHPFIGALVAKGVILQAVFPGCVAQNDRVEWIAIGCESVPTLENGGAVFVGDGDDRHLEVTFTIRKGWRWTDGTPVTARDAVYLWKLIMDPRIRQQSRPSTTSSTTLWPLDDSTIVYKFLSNAQAKAAEAGTLTGNVPFAAYKDDYIANDFSASGGPVVDQRLLQRVPAGCRRPCFPRSRPRIRPQSDFARKPMGDGPYVVKEWKAGQEIALVKSDQPYPLGDAKITNIVYRFIPNAQSVVAALQSGRDRRRDHAAGRASNARRSLTAWPPAAPTRSPTCRSYAWEHIDLNTTKFPLDDVRVRQALYSAIDKQTIVNTLYSGKYYPVELPGAVLPGNSWAYTSDYTKYPFDLKAAALICLQQAGWDCKALPCTKQVGGETKKLEITLMTTDRSDRQQLAQVIQAMWKALNVGVNLQFLNGTACLRRARTAARSLAAPSMPPSSPGWAAMIRHSRVTTTAQRSRAQQRLLGRRQLFRLVQPGGRQGLGRLRGNRRHRRLAGETPALPGNVLQELYRRCAGDPALRQQRADCPPFRLQELPVRPNGRFRLRLECAGVGADPLATEQEAMPPPPSGTVTFLFTDIEGSTRLWQEHADAMPVALRRHHAILHGHRRQRRLRLPDRRRRLLRRLRHGNRWAAGDRRCPARPADRAVGRDRAHPGAHGAAHRGGRGRKIPTGSGQYASGLTLSRAARLLSAGHGGQVLLLAATHELVRDHLPPGVTLRDCGARRLKDLIRPEQIFQVVAADLRPNFPAAHAGCTRTTCRSS